MVFMVTNFREVMTRALAPLTLALAAVLMAAGSASAAQPLPWQLGLQPPAGSIAEMADDLHNLLLVVITLISLFVLALLVYVGVRFRASANPVPSKTSHNTVIEILWTVIPVLILVGIAVPSFRLLYYLDKTAETDMVIKVTGNQWYWNYEYPDEGIAFDSYRVDEEDLKDGQIRLLSVDYPMVVPENTRIKLLITGNDVMHSYFVPSLAVQVYAFIGRTNEVWIDVPEGEKTYYGQCNQICGVNHAYMPIEVRALPEAEYKAWLETAREEFAMNTSVPQAAPEAVAEENILLASAN
ncbi:MAG: cytochrome c oxidase subunit II [Pseudomonadota bacterium]|nr:cytochrome c oxidase subunit II [Pseudomonadota bacterium]MEC7236730.1 cytochrome c oxidase subunit II [Pseudomonadota bacterium]